MKIIKSKCGKDIYVDDITFPYLSKFKWQINARGYACRKEKGKVISMHRELLGLNIGDTVEGEHKDRNKLNNILSNLRESTHSENMMNRSKYNKHHSSRYKGVHFCNRVNRWIAKIKKDRKIYHIGSYLNEEGAGLAYNKKALELFGEFAVLNDVDENKLLPEPIKYQGVHYHKRDNKWVANGKYEGKIEWLGYYASQYEALQARNKWANLKDKKVQEWRGKTSEYPMEINKKKISITRKKNIKRV